MMSSVFETLDWLLKLIFSPLRKNFSSTVLSPPFTRTQVAFMHRERLLVKIKARGKADRITFSQIFSREDYSLTLINREEEVLSCYEEILSLGKSPLVLDVGANIGLSAVYFKIKFPAAHLIAVEPEENNFKFLQRLASQYGFYPIQGGLASRKGFLGVVDPGLGENGFRTEELGPDKSMASVQGIPLDDLAKFGEETIPFLLKIDIEGAEKLAFETLSASLANFKLICIEPHDWLLVGSAGMNPFLRQISKFDFDLVVRGENIFFLNNSWNPHGAPNIRRSIVKNRLNQ